MAKFVLDADGAIKLAKSGALLHLVAAAKCFMPGQVYQEVMRGKEKMYEDAFIVEQLVRKSGVTVVEVEEVSRHGLGQGECAALALFAKIKADAIISDDRKFLSVLEDEGVPFIIPTDAIVFLAVKKVVSKHEAIKYLDRIAHVVRIESYNEAKEKVGGE